MAELTHDPRALAPCVLTGGGPADGSTVLCRNDRTLMRIGLVVRQTGPGPYDVVVSDRWVHAYVRLDKGVFAYDGIRER